MGIRVKFGLMDFVEDWKKPLKCSVCKEPSFRIVAKNGKEKMVFGMPLFEVKEALKGAATDRPEVFFVEVFKCVACNHIDLYGTNIATSFPL
jgi:hypothetical protein